MNDGLLNLTRNGDSKAEMAGLMIALAFSESLGVVTYQGPKIDLDSIEKDFVIEPKQEEPFFTRETAYERRNRGQKWYRKFNKRKNK